MTSLTLFKNHCHGIEVYLFIQSLKITSPIHKSHDIYQNSIFPSQGIFGVKSPIKAS